MLTLLIDPSTPFHLSFVFYRFKSQKEPSRISFDGTGISVWDLKKEIIQENKMGKGTDFDFAIYNADTEEGEATGIWNAGQPRNGECEANADTVPCGSIPWNQSSLKTVMPA